MDTDVASCPAKNPVPRAFIELSQSEETVSRVCKKKGGRLVIRNRYAIFIIGIGDWNWRFGKLWWGVPLQSRNPDPASGLPWEPFISASRDTAIGSFPALFLLEALSGLPITILTSSSITRHHFIAGSATRICGSSGIR